MSHSPTPPMDSTAALLARVRGGDGVAREALFERYLPLLRRWAHGRLPARARGVSDTDDLVQMTLIRALNHVEDFESRHEGAFLAYLRQILLNQVRDEIRKTNRRPSGEEIGDDLQDPGPSPLDQTIGRQAVERYEAALATLPKDQQQAVIMRLELGLTYEEIALAVGRPTANAARKMVERAIARLAEQMHGR
jgi:RNA polymerase sigma factor (sigma-70 family)